MLSGAMKSLFKSGARGLGNRLSKDDADDAWPRPLGLRVGAAVDIDTLPLRMHADDIHVALPEETLLIAAQGYVDLGDSTYVHRYYTADDVMIQVLTAAGVDDRHIEEVTLYVPHESHYPSGEGGWAQWTSHGGRIGAPAFRLEDGTEYRRIWFDTTRGYAEPVTFTEAIVEEDEADASDVVHTAMLYGRNLQEGKKNEYLLVSAEAYAGEKTVELMIGVDLELAQLKVL